MPEKRGSSLVEVLVASVIFSLVMLGLSSVFVSAAKQIVHIRERMSSAQIGKFFVDPLQNDVRQSTWDQAGNLLQVGVTPAATQKINNRNFTGEYTVSSVAGTVLRRVKTKITWNE